MIKFQIILFVRFNIIMGGYSLSPRGSCRDRGHPMYTALMVNMPLSFPVLRIHSDKGKLIIGAKQLTNKEKREDKQKKILKLQQTNEPAIWNISSSLLQEDDIWGKNCKSFTFWPEIKTPLTESMTKWLSEGQARSLMSFAPKHTMST